MSTIRWTSPSNIALIKYWGKHGVQLPANPSISFTLSECKTDTEIEFVEKGSGTKVIFEREERADFVPKVDQLIARISDRTRSCQNTTFSFARAILFRIQVALHLQPQR